jgi:hypothetical protein
MDGLGHLIQLAPGHADPVDPHERELRVSADSSAGERPTVACI